MRKILILAFVLFAFQNVIAQHQMPEGAVPYEKAEECKECHETIYNEWKESIHSRSSAHTDKAHAAVHVAFSNAMEKKKKQGKKASPNYHCANCHTPMADNIKALMKGKAKLNPKNWKETEGISCTFCHRVESIVKKEKFNSYTINKDGALNVSQIRGADSSDHHKVKASPLFKEGEMCLGCHSHKVNGKGGVVCSMDEETGGKKVNCLNCHMDEIDGAPATDSKRKKHFSHKVMGGHFPEMVKTAAKIDVSMSGNNIKVVLENKLESHKFPSTNPLRLGWVKLSAKNKSGKEVWTNYKKMPMEDKQGVLMRVFTMKDKKTGKVKVGVPSWENTGNKDSRLKPKEKRTLNYKLPGKVAGKVTQVDAKLMYRLFNPKAIKNMKIPKEEQSVVEVSISTWKK